MKFLKKTLIVNLVTILAVFFSLAIFSFTPQGKPLFKTLFLLPEVLPNSFIHPLQWVTKKPMVDKIKVQDGEKEIVVDTYRPYDLKKHPAIILVISGVLPSSTIVSKYSQALARMGFAVFVPDIPEIDNVKKVDLRAKQVNILVKLFGVVSEKDFVDKDKISYIGFCAGGSLVLLASADNSIASQVKSVVVISPYFNALTTYKQIYLKEIEDTDRIYSWKPNSDTVLTTNRLLINSLPERDGKIFEKWSGNGGIEDYGQLSQDGELIYSFIVNSEKQRFLKLWNQFPKETKETLSYLSPSTHTKDLKAHVFILSDNKDTIIPHTESQDLARSLPGFQRDYVGLDLLEHSQLARHLPRLETFIELFKVYSFVLKILVHSG